MAICTITILLLLFWFLLFLLLLLFDEVLLWSNCAPKQCISVCLRNGIIHSHATYSLSSLPCEKDRIKLCLSNRGTMLAALSCGLIFHMSSGPRVCLYPWYTKLNETQKKKKKRDMRIVFKGFEVLIFSDIWFEDARLAKQWSVSITSKKDMMFTSRTNKMMRWTGRMTSAEDKCFSRQFLSSAFSPGSRHCPLWPRYYKNHQSLLYYTQ